MKRVHICSKNERYGNHKNIGICPQILISDLKNWEAIKHKNTINNTNHQNNIIFVCAVSCLCCALTIFRWLKSRNSNCKTLRNTIRIALGIASIDLTLPRIAEQTCSSCLAKENRRFCGCFFFLLYLFGFGGLYYSKMAN